MKKQQTENEMFIYDPKYTYLCALKLCPTNDITGASTYRHFRKCSGYESISFDGKLMFRYFRDGKVEETPYCKMLIPGRNKKGAQQPLANEEDWVITKDQFQ